MAVIKAVNSKASIGKAINYVTKDTKTDEKLISGINCSPDTAITEMQTTKEMWHKKDGRQYKHYVQSFDTSDNLTPEKAHEIGLKFAEHEKFKGHEVIVATHTDKDHLHNHFIINSVNFENGKKFQDSKADLYKLRGHNDELCRENDLSVPQNNDEITSFNMDKYKSLEKAITSGYDSYVHKCYESVVEVREKATSRKDFIEKMKDKGFDTNWTDNRKHITFTDIDRQEHGEKKCKVRNSNLEKTYKEPFGKEDLERGFEINNERAETERQAREQLERAREVGRGTGTGNTDILINNINQSIKNARDAVSIDERQRRDRLAKEESVKREQDRAREQKTIARNAKSTTIER